MFYLQLNPLELSKRMELWMVVITLLSFTAQVSPRLVVFKKTVYNDSLSYFIKPNF